MTNEDNIIKLIYEVQDKKSIDSKLFDNNFAKIRKIILKYSSNKEELSEWDNLIQVYKIQYEENCSHPNIKQEILDKTLNFLKEN